jgi:hypothetical protein
MSDQEYVCHICNAVFAEEQVMLDHFCPGSSDNNG